MERSLSSASRALTWLLAASYAVLGAVLYVAPEWAAREFAWNISEFVAMTMGGWCLGNAVMAWLAARDWYWSTARPLSFTSGASRSSKSSCWSGSVTCSGPGRS